jgi:hypothetical protein
LGELLQEGHGIPDVLEHVPQRDEVELQIWLVEDLEIGL